MFPITSFNLHRAGISNMPVSLSEWRVRIGRYVQPRQDDTASIIKSCRTHFRSLLKLLSSTYSPKKKSGTQQSTAKGGSGMYTPKDCLTALREHEFNGIMI